MKYVLSCRICERKDAFDTVDQINRSSWSEVSPMGAVDSDWSEPDQKWYRHPAYCPDHSV